MLEVNKSLKRARSDGLRPYRSRRQGYQHGEEEPAGRRGSRDRDPVSVPGQHPRSDHYGNGHPLSMLFTFTGMVQYKVSANPDEPGSAGLRHHHRRRRW